MDGNAGRVDRIAGILARFWEGRASTGRHSSRGAWYDILALYARWWASFALVVTDTVAIWEEAEQAQ